jgi:hypothetical protein
MVGHSDLLWVGERRQYLAWANVNYEKNGPFQDVIILQRRKWEL